MKKFILQIVKYSLIVIILLEIVVRMFSLVNDTPERDIDQNGLQVFKKNQEGKSHGEKWRVNDSGFLGHNDINGENQVLIIGDSFVENIMNPFDCRQSSFFKKDGFDVFEIGRSGVTFIEGLEFYNKYKSNVNPRKTIFIIDNSDLEESVWEIQEFKDRVQISLTHLTISESIIKYKYLKKILYNYKTLYFLYLKHLNHQKLNPRPKQVKYRSQKSRDLILKLIDYSDENYDLENVLFVFRGSNDFKVNFNQKKINFIELNLMGENFKFSKSDSHWNCYGHKIASEKILNYLNNL